MFMMVSFCAVLFPRGVLDEILNLIESVSEGFPSYSYQLNHDRLDLRQPGMGVSHLRQPGMGVN